MRVDSDHSDMELLRSLCVSNDRGDPDRLVDRGWHNNVEEVLIEFRQGKKMCIQSCSIRRLDFFRDLEVQKFVGKNARVNERVVLIIWQQINVSGAGCDLSGK